ncbi:MAG: hypothetical protein OEW17_00645 [Gemmatimonadota bacterium]|nr:hypothetical protein [Gemmatimonadota bacterium]MDH4347289.1 hypothetical protein [Gemmatimonadota bacterium]
MTGPASPGGRKDRLISLDELLQIVTDAGLLHQKAFYETSLSRLLANGSDPLADIATVYEIAASLDIPEERIRDALATRYPEPEEQLRMLESQRATATTRAVARTYQAELLARLRQGLPSRSFESTLDNTARANDQSFLSVKWVRDHTVRFMLVDSTEVAVRAEPRWRSLFGLLPRREQHETRRDEVVVGKIEIGNELVPHAQWGDRGRPGMRLHRTDRIAVGVTVSSAVFLKLCAGTLEDLRKRFDRHNGVAYHEVEYDYVVE